MATTYQHGWIRAAEQLASADRRVRRLVVGAQAAVAAAFAVGGLAALPAPEGWQLVLLAAAAGWSAFLTDALARRRRAPERCCIGQLPTALVAVLGGVAGPRSAAPAAVALLLLVVLAACPYVETVHLAVLAGACGAGVLGVLAAADPGRFPAGWVGALAVLAVGAGLARQSRGHMGALRDLVELEATDAVTGLPNARYLRQALEQAFADAGARLPLALVAVEIDGYRDLDSAHGFRVADDVLAGVTDRLRATLPPGTTFARGEGDVLVAVLTGADVCTAWDVAAELLAAAEERPPRPDGEPDLLPAVRLAAGIAVHPAPDILDRPVSSGPALLAQAEQALAASLRHGDGVHVALRSSASARDTDVEVARPAYP